MKFLVWLHIFVVIFLIGPVTVAMSAAPRAVKAGTEGLPLLRWFHRTTRWYGIGTLLVLVTGGLVVSVDKHADFADAWLSASMAMFVIAFLLVLFSAREQRRAVASIEAGRDAAVEAGRMSAIAGFAALLWVAILVLMVWRPGAH